MQILRSKLTDHLKPIVIAFILALQAQSLYVTWELSRTIEEKTSSYLDEAAILASSILQQRINAVVASLSAIAGDVSAELDTGDGMAAVESLLQRYKALWGYASLTLVSPDGKSIGAPGHMDDNERELARHAVLMKKPAMGKCLYHDAISYAIPVMHGGEVRAVLMASRTSKKAYDLLNISIFKDQGVALLMDYGGHVLIKRWPGRNGDTPPPALEFLDAEKKFLPEVIGPDYDLHASGHFHFHDKSGKGWFITQRHSQELGITAAFAAPESVILKDLPSLRWQNTFWNIISFALILLIIGEHLWMRRAYLTQLNKAATTDPLTGGPNMASFFQQVEKLVETGLPYAFVSIDINKFKVINDKYGMDKANEFLKLTYDLLDAHTLADELCARPSADTFFLLLRWSGEERLRERLSCMMDEIMERKHRLGLRHKYGLSAGVYVIDDASVPPVLMCDHSNLARTEAKKDSTGSIVFFDKDAARDMLRNAELLNSFESSLAAGDFRIVLQPKVNIHTDVVAGAEALVRWKHPQLGPLSPAVFLSVLEQSGHIIMLDLWVFEEVCALLARWEAEGRDMLPIAVNLSRTHLKDEHFLNNYLKIIQKYGIKPHWIELELTETVFMQDEEEISATFASIRSHGLRCAIDDFGTGYSSLSMLKNANVDTVKLDRSFFAEGDLNDQTRSVVSSITQLTAALGLTCVAEGVEERSTVEYLLSTDCTLVQGWVYSKPLEVAGFELYAFNNEGRRRLLGSGFLDSAHRAMDSQHSLRSRQMRGLLNGLGGVGAYVVKKNSREILFCNDTLLRHSGVDSAEGLFCNVLWAQFCHECPIVALGDNESCTITQPDSVLGGPVTVTISEIMWEDYTPAYLIVQVPQRFRSGEEEEEKISRLRSQALSWQRKAQEDDLTRLLSRSQFKAEVERRMAEDRHGLLMFIDLDGFKQVNDRFGHHMGDQVLKNSSERIRLSFRRDDLIGRFGGDEFIVYASGFNDSAILEQRLRSLSNLLRHPHSHGDETAAISASVGVARFPEDARTYTELENCADRALYEAKRRGKDQHVYYKEL